MFRGGEWGVLNISLHCPTLMMPALLQGSCYLTHTVVVSLQFSGGCGGGGRAGKLSIRLVNAYVVDIMTGVMVIDTH